MEALCRKRGLCSDDHGSVLFVQVCVCVHMPICVLHSLAEAAAAFLNHHLYATTHLLLSLSDSSSTCLSPLHLLFFKMCSRGRALYLLKVFRVVFSLSVGDLYPLASRKLLPKNRVCLYAGHIHTIPTVWVSEWACVCLLCVFVCHMGELIVGSAHTNSSLMFFHCLEENVREENTNISVSS